MKATIRMFVAVILLFGGAPLFATTLFSGNFATVTVATPNKDLAVN